MNSLTIVCLSDTHSQHDQFMIPDGDILIHAGDFTNHGGLSEVRRFNLFLETLPHRHKIVIAGNHELGFDKPSKPAIEGLLSHAIYLQDRLIEIEGINIYGSPWTPWFNGMAFNLNRGPELRKVWEQIPGETDILITHGPPYGIHDTACPGGELLGCEDLLETVKKIRPQFHIFGHIHGGYGITEKEGFGNTKDKTVYINACICREDYQPLNPPIVIEYKTSGE